MTVRMSGEALFLCLSLLFGMLSGGVYELFRLIRAALTGGCDTLPTAAHVARSYPLIGRIGRGREGRLGRIFEWCVTVMADLAFCLLLGAGYTVFLYAAHGGIFRLYSLLGVIFGFWVYYISLGRLFLLVLSYLLLGVRLSLRYLLFFLFLPMRLYLGHIRRFLPPFSVSDGRQRRPSLLALLPCLVLRLWLALKEKRELARRMRCLARLFQGTEIK